MLYGYDCNPTFAHFKLKHCDHTACRYLIHIENGIMGYNLKF